MRERLSNQLVAGKARVDLRLPLLVGREQHELVTASLLRAGERLIGARE